MESLLMQPQTVLNIIISESIPGPGNEATISVLAKELKSGAPALKCIISFDVVERM